METGRNKRRSGGSDDGERTTRPRLDEGDDRTVTEEEVEEFYAILRRMHEASKAMAFRKGSGGGVGGGGRRGTGAASWVPAFKLEDFEEVGDVKVNGTETPANEAEISSGDATRLSAVAEEERVGEDGNPACLDLNTKPEHKGLGHVKPQRGGGSTAPRPNF